MLSSSPNQIDQISSDEIKDFCEILWEISGGDEIENFILLYIFKCLKSTLVNKRISGLNFLLKMYNLTINTVEFRERHMSTVKLNNFIKEYKILDLLCLERHSNIVENTLLIIGEYKKTENFSNDDLIHIWDFTICNFNLIKSNYNYKKILNIFSDIPLNIMDRFLLKEKEYKISKLHIDLYSIFIDEVKIEFLYPLLFSREVDDELKQLILAQLKQSNAHVIVSKIITTILDNNENEIILTLFSEILEIIDSSLEGNTGSNLNIKKENLNCLKLINEKRAELFERALEWTQSNDNNSSYNILT